MDRHIYLATIICPWIRFADELVALDLPSQECQVFRCLAQMGTVVFEPFGWSRVFDLKGCIGEVWNDDFWGMELLGKR